MGAKVQPKTYFPGSMTDLNKGFHNGVWDPYHNDKSHRISNPVNSQHYDYFLTSQGMDGYTGYAKEQIKQTILKHETIFRHQLQELHRLYKRQTDLMNPVATETSKFGHFLSQVPSDVFKERPLFASSFSLVDSSFSRASTSVTDTMYSPVDSIKGKSTFRDFSPLVSKTGVSERKVIDLELPAEVDMSNKGNVFNLADLNEPFQVEETAFSVPFSHKNRMGALADVPQKHDSSANRTLFGVDIGERNHTQSFVSPWRNTNSSVQRIHRLNSPDSANQDMGLFAGNSRLTTNPVRQTSLSFINGINSKDLVSNGLEDLCAREKHRFLDMWKNHETPVQALPSWLTAKPCLQKEQLKSKEMPVHHINLNSLQNHSHQFFKKTEMTECNGTHVFKKLKIDETQSITKILGVPIVESHCKSKDSEEENGKKNHVSDTRHHIDLNLSLVEEDTPPSFPESVVKIAMMEIDLEAPAVLESDTDDGSMDNTDLELVNIAAEAIVSISLSEPSADNLMWFAEVITSNYFKKTKESIPEGMDYLEYMTLQLETEEIYDNYKPIIVEEQKEETGGSFLKRTTRKGQGRRGRQRRDFQKDILPSIVSLSRREVTEDLQIFEEALSATGVSWQSNWSKRKSAARNGRGRRQLVVADTLCNSPPPPTTPLAAAVATSGEQSICWEMSLEKSLGGWGRRTRRLPRQRCQNGGNHNSSPTLKC